MSILHIGHVRCSSNHGSMQPLWNSCLWIKENIVFFVLLFGLNEIELQQLNGDRCGSFSRWHKHIHLLAWKYSNHIGRFVWFNADRTTVIVAVVNVIRFDALRRNFGDHSLCNRAKLSLKCKKWRYIFKKKWFISHVRPMINDHSPIFCLWFVNSGIVAHNRKPAKQMILSSKQ